MMDKENKCTCNGEVNKCGCHEEIEHSHESCGCHEEAEHSHESCGCGCGDEIETLTVELEDEEGNVITCEIIDGFDYKDKEYAVLLNPQEDTYYIFEVVGDDEDGELVVPSEEEFEDVREYYENLVAAEE
ncbi:DUF1292 domain-containing protein [Hathewaya histolytica]|uniref:Protein of uncharacterized function (DUF1292) n=2 Tax=Hathewaya histolytica TaxID=1498 RepID=A0A4U9R9N5_HATHI|nr:Protein of uncharacterised function (DUF1292) [Hathewaya histolytica]